MKFIHLSDLHFKYDDDKHNQKIRDRLTYIKDNYDSHHLIITGDIVHNGYHEEFLYAYNALSPLLEPKRRIFICPGNHDYGKGGTEFSQASAYNFDNILCFPLQEKTFAGGKTPVLFEIPEESVLLIALNTPFMTYTKSDWARGEVGTGQLSSLKDILDHPIYENMVKILFFHHHPFERQDLPHRIADEILEMEDSAELMQAIEGKVNVVLFGHKHYSGRWSKKQGNWPNSDGPWPDLGPHGIQEILASGNSYWYNTAWEIITENDTIDVKDIYI